MMHCTFILRNALCSLVCLLLSGVAAAQPLTEEELYENVAAAHSKGDSAALSALVRNNRLDVKPVVLRLLSESLEADIRGNPAAAHRDLRLASELSRSFEEHFGEESLRNILSYAENWTLEDKQLRLEADRLYKEAGELRSEGATRDAALSNYLRALELYRHVGDSAGVGATLGGIGVVYWYGREADIAINYISEALRVRNYVDDRKLAGNSHSDLGQAYWYFIGDNERALEHHLQAERLRSEIGDTLALAATLANAGLAYWDLGRLDEATGYFERAAMLHGAMGDERRLSSALLNAGILLTERGKYSDALDRLDRAREIRERLDDGLAETINWIGIVHRHLGDYDAALENFAQVLQLSEADGDTLRLARAYSNSGIVLQWAGRYALAETYYMRALPLFVGQGDRQGELDVLINLGSNAIDLEQYEASERYLLPALELSRTLQNIHREALALILLGNARLRQGGQDDVLDLYAEGLDRAKKVENPQLEWGAYTGYGEYYERRGELKEALRWYETALDGAEEIRGGLNTEADKASFLSERLFIYEAVVHLLNRLHREDPAAGHANRAFRTAERAKARAFLDLLGEAVSGIRSGVDSTLIRQQEAVVAEIGSIQRALRADETEQDEAAQLRSKLQDAEMEYERIRRRMRYESPAFAQLRYPASIGVSEVQRALLEPNSVLLQYSLGDSSSYVWAVTMDQSRVFELPTREVLNEQVEVLRFALTNVRDADVRLFAGAARTLYRLLIEPVSEFIAEGRHLIIVPDGVLFYVPFEVLLTSDPNVESVETDPAAASAFARLPYLIRRNSLSYGQSASVLMHVKGQPDRRRPSPERQLLAFGDPTFASETGSTARRSRSQTVRSGLDRLEESGSEVRAIASLFPAGQATVFVREAATEENVKKDDLLERYRFVHFATHGLVNEKRPDFSSLVLAQEEGSDDDGLLHGAEIFNLQMNADLVVLSACETALGKMVRGEGMMGLTRAFMYAGAPSLVVSLWRVADRSTAVLMERFYEAAVREDPDFSEALRTAKLRMLDEERFPHPFHWAPFVLIGDWH